MGRPRHLPGADTGQLPPSDRWSSHRSRAKYLFIRFALRLIVGALLRVRIEGRAHIPPGPYVMCFSHPSWTDPFLIAAYWPGPERQFILGPKEQDMRVGWRNRLIAWGERGVTVQRDGRDTRDVARRVSAVLRGGHVLAVSGEGRLSDREGEVAPFLEGSAFFALRDRVPVLPVGIVGTRWLRWGKTVGFVVGEPIQPPAGRASRASLRTFTATIQTSVETLIRSRQDGPAPTGFWRNFSELFNDRPWLDEPGTATREAHEAGPSSAQET